MPIKGCIISSRPLKCHAHDWQGQVQDTNQCQAIFFFPVEDVRFCFSVKEGVVQQ